MKIHANPKTAITIWIDESTEIKIEGREFNLIGYLITNSDREEFVFLNKLKQARKAKPICWNTLHGVDIKNSDTAKINLIRAWLNIFKEDADILFHSFLYERNDSFISQGQTYEHYFAKQSVFSLANKMKNTGMPIQTIFKDIGTLTILFDRRRSHTASITDKSLSRSSVISRFNKLESVYIKEIKNQIKKISGKDADQGDFTIRFSFLSSECFDGMQFTDVMLYLIRSKLEGKNNTFTKIFDEFTLSGLDAHTKTLGFERIYAYDKKFNFLRSAT